MSSSDLGFDMESVGEDEENSAQYIGSCGGEYQLYYDNFRTGYWADPDADVCRCKGRGWVYSEVDTWHECPYHKGQPHPEEDYPDPSPEVMEELLAESKDKVIPDSEIPF